MPTLIDRTGQIEDRWSWFGGDDEAVARACPDSRLILTPGQWQLHAKTLAGKGATLGLCLEPDDELEAIRGLFDHIRLIAVRFPAFTDGRGYSTARLLRQRYGWTGELRAVGDVLRDQMFYLSRCGFDTFDLKDGESVADALAGFGDFTEAYQSAADRGPLFRRRGEAPAAASSALQPTVEGRWRHGAALSHSSQDEREPDGLAR